MQDGIIIGFVVHKATISVGVARDERGGEVRIGPTMSASWQKSWPQELCLNLGDAPKSAMRYAIRG